MRLPRLLFSLVSLTACGLAQTANSQYVISTAAGVPPAQQDGGPATAALLRNPLFLTVSKAGDIYFGEQWGFDIRKITPDGVISTVAGKGLYGNSANGGQATSALIGAVSGLAFDSSGNLYFAESKGSERSPPEACCPWLRAETGPASVATEIWRPRHGSERLTASALIQREIFISRIRAITGFARWTPVDWSQRSPETARPVLGETAVLRHRPS